jgi:hypothetical protein
MIICQPDHRGRVNLGKLVSQGDTWGIVVATEDRIELVRMKPVAKKRKRSFLEHMARLRAHGFQTPERDSSPVRIPEL